MKYEEHKAAADTFRAVRQAYRDGKITDDEYIRAREVWEKNQALFDRSRNEVNPNF